MRNILINFSMLKCGGGQNVALNFLSVLNKVHVGDDTHYFFLVAADSAIYHYVKNEGKYNYFVCPQSPIKRLFFEILKIRKILRKYHIDIIYSYFGYGLFPKKIPQVSGAADSNLLFPEVDFWVNYKGAERLKRWIVDKYRIYGLRHAQGIIFENEGLEKRYHELFGRNVITTTIKPSISKIYEQEPFLLSEKLIGNMKGLFLCGWQLNKNILLIPEIAYNFKLKGYPFHILLTAPEDHSPIHEKFNELVDFYEVHEYISIIGQVKKEELVSLYEQVDIVFLLSRLESFSNNIIEAWTYKRVLVISDELWAHSICNDAAKYVDRNSAVDIVNSVIEILENKTYYDNLVNKGLDQLREYPSIENKTIQELEFIDRVYENH